MQNTSLRITSPTSSRLSTYSDNAASNTRGPASEKYGFTGSFAPTTRNESHVWNRGFSGSLHASGCAQRVSFVFRENVSPASSIGDDTMDSLDGCSYPGQAPEGALKSAGKGKRLPSAVSLERGGGSWIFLVVSGGTIQSVFGYGKKGGEFRLTCLEAMRWERAVILRTGPELDRTAARDLGYQRDILQDLERPRYG